MTYYSRARQLSNVRPRAKRNPGGPQVLSTCPSNHQKAISCYQKSPLVHEEASNTAEETTQLVLRPPPEFGQAFSGRS